MASERRHEKGEQVRDGKAMPSRGSDGQSWTGRPWAARAVRVAVVVVPFVTSVVTAYVLSRVLPAANGAAWLVVRLIGIAVAATVALRVVDRAVRRLLPLATLLDLTLLFPEEAPSRYRMALRNGASNVELQERIDTYLRSGRRDTAAAAEHLLDLVAALSRHDRITRGHSERVRAYAQLIGEEMGLSGRELDQLRWAALIHDVGKLRIPTEILNKPGKLTDEEFAVIKLHPEYGAELAAPLAGWLGDAVHAVVQHHEKWDGSGYPKGLRGSEISPTGRIVAVADVFDVMTSVRSYKHACSPVEARAELARCAGTHFDPAVVRAFMNLSIRRLRMVMGPLSWLAQLSLFPQSIFATASPTIGAAGVSGTAGGTTAAVSASTASSIFGTAVTAAVGFAATGVGAVAMDADTVVPERPAAVEVVLAGDEGVGEGVSDLGFGALPPVAIDAVEFAVPASGTGDPETSDAGPPGGAASVPTEPGVADVLGDPTAASAGAAASAGTAAGTAPTPTSTPANTSVTVPVPPPNTTLASPTTLPTFPAATEPAAPAAQPPPTTLPPAATTPPGPTPSVITAASFLLAAPAPGDLSAQEVLPLVQRSPQQSLLPNYDTDRDTLSGLGIVRGGALALGDPVRLQRFAYDPDTAVTVSGRQRLSLWVSPVDGEDRGIRVLGAIARCDTLTGVCTVVVSGHVDHEGRSSQFALRTIDFGELDVSVAAHEHLEVWIAADASSGSDLRLAYDAGQYRSEWQVG